MRIFVDSWEVRMEEMPTARLMVTETEVDASFYKAALEGSGISVFISGMEGSVFGAALDGPDEIEIIVYQKDLEASQAIIAELDEEPENEIPTWDCSCGAEVDEGFGVCWSCGGEYDAGAKSHDSDNAPD
jgi:hypothetical protein